MLFSKGVTELYEAVVSTADADERAELMLELAQVFVEETDDSDQHLGEDVHDLLSDFIEQRMKFERTSMRLARVLMRTLPAYVAAHEGLEAEIEVEDDSGKKKSN